MTTPPSTVAPENTIEVRGPEFSDKLLSYRPKDVLLFMENASCSRRSGNSQHLTDGIMEKYPYVDPFKNRVQEPATKRNLYIFESRIVPRYNNDDEVISVIGIATDVTERVQIEQQLKSALNRMRHINTMQNNFASMVSHEFRTPLTHIMNSTQLLQRAETPPISEKRQQRYQRIYRNIQAITELMEDIIKFGEAAERVEQFHAEPFNLNAFCSELREQHDPKGLRIIHGINVKNPILNADAKLLRMALGNILSNALKYSDDPVIVHIDEMDEGIRFMIKDNGIGIPQEEHDALFQHFYRASNTTNIPGSGLGLAIAQRAIAIHDGTLQFESDIGKGTTFYLTIPRH